MITQQTINERKICERYVHGVSIIRLAKEFNLSRHFLKKILIRNNVTLRKNYWARKHFFDMSFFKKIDTEEKAYFLGLLYADGCTAEHSINLAISSRDVELLEKFKKAIKFTGPIEKIIVMIDYGDKYGIKPTETVKIRLNSMELRQDVINLGCVPRKTFTLSFPSEKIVPRFLVRHFIRGYFDGDGCVYERKQKRKD